MPKSFFTDMAVFGSISTVTGVMARVMLQQITRSISAGPYFETAKQLLDRLAGQIDAVVPFARHPPRVDARHPLQREPHAVLAAADDVFGRHLVRRQIDAEAFDDRVAAGGLRRRDRLRLGGGFRLRAQARWRRPFPP